MTELELYHFVTEFDLDWNVISKENEYEVILFVPFVILDTFSELVGYSFFDEPHKCYLKYDCIALEMMDICDYFGIDPKNIFGSE